jgi:hypothetical protein
MQQSNPPNLVHLSGSGSFALPAGHQGGYHYFHGASSASSASSLLSQSSAQQQQQQQMQSLPSSPFSPSSSASSSAVSSPSAYTSGLARALAVPPEGGLTGSGEVVLGMEALAMGPPDRGMSEEEKEKFVVNVMQELQKRRMVMEAIEWYALPSCASSNPHSPCRCRCVRACVGLPRLCTRDLFGNPPWLQQLLIVIGQFCL